MTLMPESRVAPLGLNMLPETLAVDDRYEASGYSREIEVMSSSARLSEPNAGPKKNGYIVSRYSLFAKSATVGVPKVSFGAGPLGSGVSTAMPNRMPPLVWLWARLLKCPNSWVMIAKPDRGSDGLNSGPLRNA